MPYCVVRTHFGCPDRLYRFPSGNIVYIVNGDTYPSATKTCPLEAVTTSAGIQKRFVSSLLVAGSNGLPRLSTGLSSLPGANLNTWKLRSGCQFSNSSSHPVIRHFSQPYQCYPCCVFLQLITTVKGKPLISIVGRPTRALAFSFFTASTVGIHRSQGRIQDFSKREGVHLRSTSRKRVVQEGVQFWAQC